MSFTANRPSSGPRGYDGKGWYTLYQSVDQQATPAAVNSPVLASTTKEILVPKSALRARLLNPSSSAAGTGIVTVSWTKNSASPPNGTTAAFGAGGFELGPGDWIEIEVFGANDLADNYGDYIKVVVTAGAKCCFAFDCCTATGAADVG